AGTTTECGITVTDNTINIRSGDTDAYGIRVAHWLNGVAIRGNRISGGNVARTAIMVEANANGAAIEQNLITGFTERGIDVYPATDSVITTKTVVVAGNRFAFVPSAGRFEVRGGVQARGWAFFEGT